MSDLETPEADMIRDHSSVDAAPATLQLEELRPGLDPNNPGAAPDTTLDHVARGSNCHKRRRNTRPGNWPGAAFSGQGDIPLVQLDGSKSQSGSEEQRRIEIQLGVKGPFHVIALTEAVLLSFKQEVAEWDASSL